MSIDLAPWARRIILSQIDDTEYMTVCEMTQDDAEAEGMTFEQHEQAARDICDLIGEASVTVTLPGDPVCTGCGGTGQPGEDDGTPKDFAAWENGRDDALRAAESALERLREEGESDIRSAIYAVRAAIDDLGGADEEEDYEGDSRPPEERDELEDQQESGTS